MGVRGDVDDGGPVEPAALEQGLEVRGQERQVGAGQEGERGQRHVLFDGELDGEEARLCHGCPLPVLARRPRHTPAIHNYHMCYS
ncbi:hypothetical protein ACWCRF_37200 [Streptomyces sp. NPDC002405]|uniref:hypothetical protein n=1 Tax=unclassified Streptomyces TaxID=2593676 RepID=UPI0036AD6369